jgi:pimeloyl-ACP methyl ester carboxylesterase
VLLVAVGSVLAVGACSSPTGVTTRVDQERLAAPAALMRACTDSLCKGERNGAPFEIRLPQKWNGTLLLWSHGYRAAATVPLNPLDPSSTEPPVRTAEVALSDSVAQELLSKGYALAGSANKANGWAVQDSVAANEDLYAYFSKTFGAPNRVYVWGVSLGGLSTQVLAEKHPDWVAGSAPLCAPLAGTNLNLDLALDVAYGVKTLFDPSLKLTGFTSNDEAVANWEHAAKALVAAAKSGSPDAIAGLLTLKAITGAADKTQDQDGSTTTSTGTAIVESVLNALGYATFGRYELEQRVGGNPSGNAGTDYGARVADSDRALINAAAPGKLDGILARLAGGARVTPNPTARSKADALGNPSGHIAMPTLTMHTLDDPLVLAANENVYGKRVDASKASGELAGFLTRPPVKYTAAPYGAGHCNFTTQEQVGVIDLLDRWVRNGAYPASGAIATELGFSQDGGQGSNTPTAIDNGTATTGYDPSDLPPAWPNPQAAIIS